MSPTAWTSLAESFRFNLVADAYLAQRADPPTQTAGAELPLYEALNRYILPAARVAALDVHVVHSLRTRRRVEREPPNDLVGPAVIFRITDPMRRLGGNGGDRRNGDGAVLREHQEIDFHGGRLSHLDAFCHVSYNGKVYNGIDFKTIVTEDRGCDRLAISMLKDGIVTRGVLLDMPGARVRPADVEAWEKRTGVKISAGDVLLLRSRKQGVRPPSGSAGYDPSMFPFLRERDVAVLGHDAAQEGGTIPGVAIPLHVLTLVGLGMPLLDNLDLEALAETAAKLKRWEFMLTVAPLRVPNGSGSVVNPIALF